LKQEKDLKDLDIDLFTAGYERIYSYDGDAFVENTYTKSKFMELVENEAIEVKNGKIYEKNYSTTIRIKSILANREYQAIIDNKEVTHKIDVKTTSAGTYLKDLFDGKDVFSAPKPIGLLELLISLFDDKEMIVMDFFSGSSTTADAVMRMNASDGGNRKFIMVQLSEDLDYNLQHCKSTEKETVRNAIKLCDNIKAEHILPNVAEERIRRAGKKIYTELKDKKNSLDLLTKDVIDSDSLDIGFKVFKLDSTNIRPWDSTKKYNSNNIFDLLDVVKEGRSNLDVAYEVMLKYGVFNMPLEEVQANGKTVYSVGSNYMIISLNDEITSDDVLAIAKLEPKAVVFKESGFKSDNEKLNTEYTFKRLGIDNVKCI
jgi:adenine-specific DNA-methyltransferase